tara:strand:+ start:2584 stop:2781 length:198 start_codon:yes stop_codon:yes gene_type:complete
MMEKATGKYLFEYQDGNLSIFDNIGDSKNLIKKVKVNIRSEKEFEMEIIFETQKMEDQSEIYGDY